MTWPLRTRRALAGLGAALLLPACAAFVPLQAPPVSGSDDPIGRATTRDEVVARLGPPGEVRASDVGQVLVYRRLISADVNPNRFYGLAQDDRLYRYERLLVYLDGDGRIVRWGIEPE